MAINIYNKANTTINIDSLSVLDFILKQNTITYLTLEVIFNCDIKQIIDKYSVTIELVNPSNTSTVYAQFTPSSSDFGTTKNTIALNANPSTYGSAIGYFNTRYINKNFFNTNNSTLTSNSPVENTNMRLQVTINGVKKLFGTKTFASFSNTPMGSLNNSFNYLQTYNLVVNGFYFENTDIVSLKINNSDSAFLSVGTINNQANTPLRTSSSKDFVYNASAVASFSGSNSYALTKTYQFKASIPASKLIVKKSPTDTERFLSNNFLQETVVGCTKQFDLTLKNASSVSDSVYLEFPLFKELYTSGLVLSSIKVKATPNKVSFASTPVITAQGGAKWKIDMSYAQTGEATGTVATYAGEIELDFTHSSGNFTLIATGFTYTNSDT